MSTGGIGSTIIQALTGVNPSDIQAEATAATQQVTLAIETMITLQLVGDFLLLMLVVMIWKRGKG
jgi:hypothetical protein